MNKEDTKKAAEVMLAFAAGEEVECFSSTTPNAGWFTTSAPLWDWNGFNYRVKPKALPIYYAVDYSLPERRTAAFVGMLHDTPEAAEASAKGNNAVTYLGRVIALQEVTR